MATHRRRRTRGADDAPGEDGRARANVRPRVAGPARPAEDRGLRLGGLGDALAHVAIFLAAPSRALFAAAVTAPSSSWGARSNGNRHRRPSEPATAILSPNGESWRVLDFEDIEKALASKLSDDDLAASLLCIDAVNSLKKLKLSGCVGISGVGLHPLHGSAVLEQIDLSLVRQHQSPIIRPKPLLSQAEVLPILRSIVRARGSSLRHLQLPDKFRKNPTRDLNIFLGEYDQLLSRRTCSCANCKGDIEIADGDSWVIRSETGRYADFYGMQSFTCCVCTRNICDDCEVEGGHTFIEQCETCRRDYCHECKGMVQCQRCMKYTCLGCADMCEGCHKFDCPYCPRTAAWSVRHCAKCDEKYCFKCRWKKCNKNNEWDAVCQGCMQLVAPVIDAMVNLYHSD